MNRKEEKIRKILEKHSEDAWYDGRIWDGVDDGIIRAMLEFGEECFNAGLDCKNIIYGKVQFKYESFENYLNSLE